MRPKRTVVTSSNSPKIIPINYRGGRTSIIATPSGAGDYTVENTTVRIQDSSITPNWNPISSMTAQTAQASDSAGSITALRVTLNSGTDVTVDISQSDVS